jgi:hypothetical protein
MWSHPSNRHAKGPYPVRAAVRFAASGRAQTYSGWGVPPAVQVTEWTVTIGIRAIASARTSCFSAPVSLADGRSLLLLALIHKARAAGGRAESGACGVLLTFVVFAVSGNPVASESLLRCREIKPTVADQVAHELFQTVFRLSIPFRLNCLPWLRP